MFFKAYTADGSEPWYFDGGSVNLLKDINPSSSSSPREFMASDTVLFFRANDGTNGTELWKTNGTESGTQMVADLAPGSDHAYPTPLISLGYEILFKYDNATYGDELFISDGATTSLVKDINNAEKSSEPAYLTGLNGKLLFAAEDDNGRELWQSNSTEASTILLKDIYAGDNGYVENLTYSNNKVYFTAEESLYGRELYITDGTVPGTDMLKDINSGTSGSWPFYLEPFQAGIAFQADGGQAISYELYYSDGTSPGTYNIKDLKAGDWSGSYPSYITNVNGTLFFSADNGTSGSELYISDGTSIGTDLLKDINSGGDGSGPNYLNQLGDNLIFTANDGTNGNELWISDGTMGGTYMVKDINASGSAKPRFLTVVEDKVYFTATDGITDTTLWISDGTSGGTEVVYDYIANGNYNIASFTAFDDKLVFTLSNDTLGNELWITDGTDTGTHIIKDICSGNCSSNPVGVYKANHLLYFSAYDETNGYSLWQTNGTEKGTKRIPPPATEEIEAVEMELVDTTLYFSAHEISTGQELWKYECDPPNCTGIENDSVCEGNTAMFAVSTDDTSAIFRWQENQGSGFVELAEGGDYVINGDTLLINNVDTNMTGYKYRCIVEGSCFVPACSDSVTLIVKSPAVITQEPVDADVCFGDLSMIKCTATGTGLNGQWQVDEGSGFVDVVDGTHYTTSVSQVNNTSIINLGLLDITYSMNNNLYRCIINSDCSAPIYSDTAQLTVDSVMILSQTGDTSVCNGGNAVFNVNVEGQSVNYQWQISTDNGSTYGDLSNNPTYNGVNTSQLTINGVTGIMAGNLYTCIISNACQSGLYASAIELSLHPVNTPTIQQDEDFYGCVADTVNLSTAQAYNSYLWSTGETSATTEATAAGDYYVTVVDGNACESVSDAFSLTETTISTPAICLVGVDLETGQNMVVWERQREPGIESYIVYRESNTGGVYNAMDTLPFDSLSVWVDMSAEPEVKSYKYKLSAVDQCGYETPKSPYHKTMLLASSIGQGAINLNWQEYELESGSFGFVQYIIYRGTSATSLSPIDTIASDNVLYPDFNAPMDQDVFYRIAGVTASPCAPDNLKASAGPFSQSVSNLEDNRLKESSIAENNRSALKIYPNPASSQANIEYLVAEEGKVTINVYNLLGGLVEVLLDQQQTADDHKLVFNIDKASYPDGLYYIELVTGNNRIIKKLTISK